MIPIEELFSQGIKLFNPVNDHEYNKSDIRLESPIHIAAQVDLGTTIHIGAFCYIHENTFIRDCKIGRYSSIAKNVFIGGDKHPTDWLSTSRFFYIKNFMSFEDNFPYKSDHLEYYHDIGKTTIIGNDVMIAHNCYIYKGITIGDGAIVSGGSVVLNDVPPYAIVGGNPAKILKYRFPDEIIHDLLSLDWTKFHPNYLLNKNFRNPVEFLNTAKFENPPLFEPLKIYTLE
jgi:virginiamycin A acetyltransferase